MGKQMLLISNLEDVRSGDVVKVQFQATKGKSPYRDEVASLNEKGMLVIGDFTVADRNDKNLGEGEFFSSALRDVTTLPTFPGSVISVAEVKTEVFSTPLLAILQDDGQWSLPGGMTPVVLSPDDIWEWNFVNVTADNSETLSFL